MARTKTGDAWAAELVDAPKADLPDSRQHRRAKLVRKYVWASTMAFLPTLLLVLVLLGNSTAAQEPQREGAAAMTRAETQARAVAMEAVTTWLATEPSPLPTGRLLTWDGVADVPAVAEPPEGSSAQEEGWPDLEVHRMTLVTASGNLFTAEVSVESTTAGATVTAGPSLVPYTPSPSSPSSSMAWPGSTGTEVPDAVRDASSAWARAFTSGDPSQLRLLVGDEAADHAYVPLPSVELVEVDAAQATAAPQATTADSEGRQVAPDQLIVRASITLRWPGQPETGASSHAQPVHYDLLVVGADTGSPRVVAWGGPGTGPTLEPYANAVAGVQIRTQDGTEVVPEDSQEEQTDDATTDEIDGADDAAWPTPGTSDEGTQH